MNSGSSVGVSGPNGSSNPGFRRSLQTSAGSPRSSSRLLTKLLHAPLRYATPGSGPRSLRRRFAQQPAAGPCAHDHGRERHLERPRLWARGGRAPSPAGAAPLPLPLPPPSSTSRPWRGSLTERTWSTQNCPSLYPSVRHRRLSLQCCGEMRAMPWPSVLRSPMIAWQDSPRERRSLEHRSRSLNWCSLPMMPVNTSRWAEKTTRVP
mmetsp:Transcript_2032/g.4806  ORF Transcript_2032/g.4806 Transcript_2032/m.4806 type:complete len:207 (+) Transcript_2032:448-1068(+)